MRGVALVFGLVVLAGCADDGSDMPDGENPDATPTADVVEPAGTNLSMAGRTVAVLEFERVFQVHVQDVRTGVVNAGVGGVNGANCVMLSGIERIVAGEATATWQATTPLSDELELMFAGDDRARASGTSGTGISFSDLRPDDGLDRFALLVQATAPGAAIDQGVEVAIHFSYEATGPVDVDEGWTCSYS